MKKPLHHHLSDYFFPHPRNNHRPNLFSAMSVAALVLVIVVFEAGYLVQTKFVFIKTDFLASVLPGALVALTNQDRAVSGIPDVTEDALLNSVAQTVAEDMASKGYFAHVSPDGKTPWYWLEQVGYKYSYAGQNLAVNFTDSENVETAWMNSPTHRANIEKPQYTRVGIGVANGIYEGAETTFVVQFFATPPTPEVGDVTLATPPTPSGVGAPTVNVGAAQVLGTQAEVIPTAPRVTGWSGWLPSLLASPLNTLLTVLLTLFALVAASFTIALLVRGRIQHPSVLIGGTFLFVCILGAMLVTAQFSGSVRVPTDSGSASVYNAVLN